MKIIIALLLTIFLTPTIWSQTGTVINKHKFYDAKLDNEDISKFHRKRLTASVDITGIKLTAWGDECFLNIKLRNKDDALTNYTTGIYNNQPYVKYGNDKYRYRMYVNKSGNFEFDAEIRSKPSSGRYFFPFDIQSKGLDFFYQPELTQKEIDEGAYRPDSVIGSYAVYHSSKRNNVKKANGVYENYGTGKAFHIFRPRCWDSSADTVWGFIEIDGNTMRIGADSTWMANAVYPVTIDPVVGYRTEGASQQGVSGNQLITRQLTIGGTAGTTDSVGWFTSEDGTVSSIQAVIYEDDGNDDCAAYLDSALLRITTTANTIEEHTFEMVGANVSASTIYWINIWETLGSGGFNVKYDSNTLIAARTIDEWPPNDPCAFLIFGSTNREYSGYLVYTEEGGGEEPTSPRRRKEILKKSRRSG